MKQFFTYLIEYLVIGWKDLWKKGNAPQNTPKPTQNAPVSNPNPLVAIKPPEPPTIADLVAKNDKALWIQMCRDIAKEQGLDSEMTAELLATLECESGFDNSLIHPNIGENGKISSTDYFLAQLNDFWHIGEKKDFPSTRYVQEHPDEVIRWMCRMFKRGKAGLWVCYSKNLYQKYLKNYV